MKDKIRERPVEDSINQRQWKTISDDNRVRQSTMNMHQQRTTIRKSAYLLTVSNLAFAFKMADSINDQIIIDNKNYLPQNQTPQK